MANAQAGSPKQAEPLEFAYELPPVSQRKLAVIQTVAKHAVLQPDVIAARRSEFDFLDAAHNLNGLYKTFLRQYTRVRDGVEPFTGDVLQRAIDVYESSTHDQESSHRSMSTGVPDAEPEPGASGDTRPGTKARIEWQPFVVLETVEFFAADLNGSSTLMPPLTPEQATLQTQRPKRRAEPMLRSPFTGMLIPASEYDEHARIHTLDPAYATQKAKEEARRATTNLDTDHAADNLALLRAKRRRLHEQRQ